MSIGPLSPETDPPPDLPADPESSYNSGEPSWEAWSAVVVPTADEAETKDVRDLARETHLGAARPATTGPGGRREAGAGNLERDKGRLVLRRKIAEGGFGEIWEAVQASLGRTIAVKRLKPHLATGIPGGGDDTFEDTRLVEFDFRQEALITAQLEHPNIIPVYDLGRDESGRPLIAMKLVKGRLWSEVLREDPQTMSIDDYLGKHLQILISVAQAVAFAHSHHIIHRDLKPTQVMIGGFGEALLMDWGLAMASGSPEKVRASFPSLPLEPNSPLFNPVNPAGTPAFMAPEQTEKTPKRLGPWTDVYLLGGILYRILTGRNPHIGTDSATTYLLARRGTVEPPDIRAPGREIPEQLAALSMKSMEKEPEDRVESAEAFVAQLQDYLTGAGKRRESMELCARAEECLRSAATDYAALANCLNQVDRSLVLWPGNAEAHRYRQEALGRYARAARDSRDLKLARLQAERLYPGPDRDLLLGEIHILEEEQRLADERLEAAYRQARIDRDRAEEARRRADEMRTRAENLVSFLIGDFHDALQSIGRLDLIRSVTGKSLEYFDSLPEEEAGGQTLHSRAIAYLNIGDVFADEGKKPEALEAYRKARELAEAFNQTEPDSLDGMATLAESRDRTGQVLYYQGRMDEALQEHDGALTIRMRLAELQPGDVAVETGIAACRHKIGIVFWRQQNLPRALELHLESLAVFRRLASADPDNTELNAAVSWCLSTLGNVYRDRGDVDRAVEVTSEALRIRKAMMDRDPNNVSRIDDFLWTQGNLALLHLFRGDLEESLALFGAHLPLRRRLSEDDPTNVVRITAVTFPLSLMGEILFVLGRLEAAEKTINECLEITSRIFALDPTSTHIVSAYGRLHGQLAEVLVAQGRWEEAENLAEIAATMGRRALQLAPKNVMTIKVFSTSLIVRGRIAAHFEDGAKSVALWEEARDLLSRVKITGDEIDVLDLSTQLALLLRTGKDVAPWIQRLREKRWISPSLRGACEEVGYPIPPP